MSGVWRSMPWMGLLLSQFVWVGCSSMPGQKWVERGPKIRAYGEEFFSQSIASEVYRGGVTSFEIFTPSRHSVAFDFRAQEFRWRHRSGPWHDVQGFDELERETGVSEEFARYWAGALVELKSFWISKRETHCESVHVSMSESPPFLGNPPTGWFYVPVADEKQPVCVKGMKKLGAGWFFGSQ